MNYSDGTPAEIRPLDLEKNSKADFKILANEMARFLQNEQAKAQPRDQAGAGLTPHFVARGWNNHQPEEQGKWRLHSTNEKLAIGRDKYPVKVDNMDEAQRQEFLEDTGHLPEEEPPTPVQEPPL